MNFVLAIILFSFQLNAPPHKWICSDSLTLRPEPEFEGAWVKPHVLMEGMIKCTVPRLPENVKGEREIKVEIYVDKDGSVCCAKAAGESIVYRRAAIEAVLQWKFKPYINQGKAISYRSVITLLMTNAKEKAAQTCSSDKRKG